MGATTLQGGTATAGHKQEGYHDMCPKCGARRIDKQLGLEPVHDCLGWATGNPCGECYVCHMVAVFREVKRVLRNDGVVWLNLGDSFASTPSGAIVSSGLQDGQSGQVAFREATKHKAIPVGLKPKDLVGIPWRVALALQADGWWLRSDIIWAKPNPMPESVTDRPTKAHEYVFLLAKSDRYFYDADAIKEPCESGPSDIRKMEESLSRIGGKHKDLDDPLSKASALTNIGRKRSVGDPSGRNRRSIWTVATAPFTGAHFATFPPALVEPCIKAGTSEKGCCPRCGAPWVRVVERTGERATHGANNAADDARGTRHGKTSVFKTGTVALNATIGWRPTCSCNAGDPVPCVVLDPFSGAGTTVLVADRLGRNGVGLDLSGTYTRMGRDRVFNDAPLLALMGAIA